MDLLINLLIYCDIVVGVLLLCAMIFIDMHFSNKEKLNDLLRISLMSFMISKNEGSDEEKAELLFDEYSIDRRKPTPSGLCRKLDKILYIVDSGTAEYGKVKNVFFIQNAEKIRTAVYTLRTHIKNHPLL